MQKGFLQSRNSRGKVWRSFRDADPAHGRMSRANIELESNYYGPYQPKTREVFSPGRLGSHICDSAQAYIRYTTRDFSKPSRSDIMLSITMVR